MKPHIKPLPKTGDRDAFLVRVYGHPDGHWHKIIVLPRIKWRELRAQIGRLEFQALNANCK